MTTPPPPTEAVPNPHTVVAKLDGDRMTMTFTCAGNETSECHQYPDCDCESWTVGEHEHPTAVHQECWLTSWFALTHSYSLTYTGDDEEDGEPTAERSGLIETSISYDYVEWSWASAGDPR